MGTTQHPAAEANVIRLRSVAARSGQTLEDVVAAISILITKRIVAGDLRTVTTTTPDGTAIPETVLVLHERD
jgi:hypothetical protein